MSHREESESEVTVERPKARKNEARRSADLARISSLILQGATIEDISKEIGITTSQVRKEMASLNTLWVQEITSNAEQYRGMLLSKLMKIEAMALEGFADSKEKTVTDRSVDEEGGVRTSVKTFISAGEPAFLNVAKDTIKMQVQVLGLDANKTNTTVFDKDAFLDAVAEKIAEAKIAATSMPVTAVQIDEIENPAGIIKSPLT